MDSVPVALNTATTLRIYFHSDSISQTIFSLFKNSEEGKNLYCKKFNSNTNFNIKIASVVSLYTAHERSKMLNCCDLISSDQSSDGIPGIVVVC